jgi:hypothetical protein
VGLRDSLVIRATPDLLDLRELLELSRAMENCPLGVTRNCPSLG